MLKQSLSVMGKPWLPLPRTLIWGPLGVRDENQTICSWLKGAEHKSQSHLCYPKAPESKRISWVPFNSNMHYSTLAICLAQAATFITPGNAKQVFAHYMVSCLCDRT